MRISGKRSKFIIFIQSVSANFFTTAIMINLIKVVR